MFYPLNSAVLLSSGVYPKEIHKDAYKNLCKMELFANVHHRRGREDKKQSKNNHHAPNKNILIKKQGILAHRERGKYKHSSALLRIFQVL